MHLLVVADLVPPELEHHALLHDAAEVCVSDVPRPMKTDAAREVEDGVLARIYQAQGLTLPTDEEKRLIKVADIRSVNMEGISIAGPRGFKDIQIGIDHADETAWKVLRNYLDAFRPEDAVKADGHWPQRLEARLRRSIAAVHRSK
jgi:hypothetical protein